MSFIASSEVASCGGWPVGVVHFKQRMECISSAVFNGGIASTTAFFIMQVPKDYFTDDPESDAMAVRDRLGLPGDSVGMMTAAEVDHVFNVRSSVYGGTEMEAVATAGLSNQVVAGEVLENWEERHALSLERSRRMMAGTINIGVVSAVPLTMEGKVNLFIPLVEAKSAALSDFGYRETGTTSDSMAVFSPPGADRVSYTGTGSPCGIAVARAVRDAVGYALRCRLEHPVPEDPYRVLDGMGCMERLESAVASAGVPVGERDGFLRSFLSRKGVVDSLDLVMFVSDRADRIADDGDRGWYGMIDSVVQSTIGAPLNCRDDLKEAYLEALASAIRREV